MKYLTPVFFLLAANTAHCCMNEYRTMTGEIIQSFPYDVLPSARVNLRDTAFLLRQLHVADSIYQRTKKAEDYSDYGVMLVYNGQYEQAKRVFQSIEKKSPGLYQTASNLGTTYELLGQNDSAYHWIKKALQLHPDAHGGSEWIHLKVLEAKMNANGNEQYFMETNILGLDFGDSILPVNKTKQDLNKLRNDLYHQLGERMSFILPPDAVVGQLLSDLGDVSMLLREDQMALQIYGQAKDYGYTTDLMFKRVKHLMKPLIGEVNAKLQKENAAREQSRDRGKLIKITIYALGLLSLAILLYQKRKK